MRKIDHFSPSQVIALTFAALILTGTLLLMLPIAGARGEGLSFVDALFTAASASCVTGLIVVDTGTYFSTFGQLVLIGLIQLGGLGLMLFATLFSVAAGRRLGLQDRLNIQASLNQNDMQGVVNMSLRVAKYTFVIEGFFGTILAIRFGLQFGLEGIYYGYWHAISAFCNGGFDLFGHFSSLTGFVGDPVVNLCIDALILLGSLGFPVMSDLLRNKFRFRKLRVNSKLVLVSTAALTVVGTAGFAFFEQGNLATIGKLPPMTQFWASLFQSITPRTAGFNTVDLASLRVPTMFLMVILMFIGASPASTGGGIKTTTAALLLLNIWQVVKGKPDCVVFDRRISQENSAQAFAIVGMSILWVTGTVLCITYLEDTSFLYALFEVVSAYATVGMSTGLSQHLCTASKLVLALSMYAGRVGVMTFALALTARKQQGHIHYPKEDIMIG